MSTLLSLGNIFAVDEEAVIGQGQPSTWEDADVVSFNSDSSMTPATETIERNLFNGSFIACQSLTGNETNSGSLNLEMGITNVVGTEAGRLKGHKLWKSGMGIYQEQSADVTVANTISIEADPITNPTGYDLYTLSDPDDTRTTLCVREFKGGSGDAVLDYNGVVVDSIAITLTAGQIATASFSVSGIGYNTATGQTPLTNQGCGANPFVVKLATFNVDGVAVPAQDVSLTINNTNTDRTAISSTGISDKVTTGKSIELSYTVDMQPSNIAEFTKLKNNTTGALYIEMTNGASEEIRIYLPKISYSTVETGDDSGVVTLSISAMAYEDANGNALLMAVKK